MSISTEKPKKSRIGKIIAISCSTIFLCILLTLVSITAWYAGLQNNVIWKYSVGSTVMSAPLVVDDMVYFGSLHENKNIQPAIFAVDAKTGKEVWKKPITGSVFWSPTVNADMVFFGTNDGFFYGLDRETGQEHWKLSPEQRNITVEESCEQCELQFGPPIVIDGVVYVGSFDKNLYALDARNGQLKWKFTTNGSVLNAPFFTDGNLYISGNDVYIYVLDSQTGKEVKRYLVPVDQTGEQYESSGIYSTPVVDTDAIYVVNGMLMALDIETGEQKWKFGNAALSGQITTATQFDEQIIAASMDTIHSIDKKTGKPVWSFSKIKGYLFFAPTIYQDSIYFGDSNGYLYIIDAKTGRLIKQYYMYLFDLTGYFSFFPKFVFIPAVKDKVIYVGWNNYVYALRTK